jgi:hypothetical protein
MDITTSEKPETGLSEKMLHSKLAISLRNNGTLDSLKVSIDLLRLQRIVESIADKFYQR